MKEGKSRFCLERMLYGNILYKYLPFEVDAAMRYNEENGQYFNMVEIKHKVSVPEYEIKINIDV
jgi:hypothetical protein